MNVSYFDVRYVPSIRARRSFSIFSSLFLRKFLTDRFDFLLLMAFFVASSKFSREMNLSQSLLCVFISAKSFLRERKIPFDMGDSANERDFVAEIFDLPH